MKKTYRIRWPSSDPQYSKEGFRREDLERGKDFACDAFMGISIIEVEGGVSRKIFGKQFLSSDEEPKDITEEELFKCWAVMAHELSETLPDGGRKQLCAQVHHFVTTAILSSKEASDV